MTVIASVIDRNGSPAGSIHDGGAYIFARASRTKYGRGDATSLHDTRAEATQWARDTVDRADKYHEHLTRLWLSAAIG